MTGRVRELIGCGRYHIHAIGADGAGFTLCGYAYEGINGDTPTESVERGKINCGSCLRIIRHCKKIPARHMKATK